jgi:cytochrome c peroxidase
LAWSNKFLWNGLIEGKLEDIMAFEVNVFFNCDVKKLNNSSIYAPLFKKVFNSTSITTKEVAYALAQFVRTQSSTNSKFDKYMLHQETLTPSERNGYVIFNSEKGDCFHCHSIGLFNDNSYHNIGLDSISTGLNKGRSDVTGNMNDIGKFKTPSLRNIELTHPYMHDGRFATLEDVIEHYNSGVKQASNLDPIFSKPNHLLGLQLSIQEKADLVSFLRTLTDTTFTNNPKLSHP